MLLLRPVPSGSGLLFASGGALTSWLWVGVLVVPTSDPELTLAASGVLVTCRLGWFTVSEPVPVVGGVFVPCAVAEIGRASCRERVVVSVAGALTDDTGARLANEQLSVCRAGDVPVMGPA